MKKKQKENIIHQIKIRSKISSNNKKIKQLKIFLLNRQYPSIMNNIVLLFNISLHLFKLNVEFELIFRKII